MDKEEFLKEYSKGLMCIEGTLGTGMSLTSSSTLLLWLQYQDLNWFYPNKVMEDSKVSQRALAILKQARHYKPLLFGSAYAPLDQEYFLKELARLNPPEQTTFKWEKYQHYWKNQNPYYKRKNAV